MKETWLESIERLNNSYIDLENKEKIMELIGLGSISIVNIMELNKEDWEEWGR